MTFLLFFWCLKGCRFEAEDSEDGSLSTGGFIDRVPGAEEKRGHHYFAALLGNIGPINWSRILVLHVRLPPSFP